MTEDNWLALAIDAPVAPALGQHVVDHLRRLIITGELAAGTHLVEAQLSKAFNVSRGPVRDALRQLELEGLVAPRRRGVFVIGLTRDDIDELYVLRLLLETQAVRLCMMRNDVGFDRAHDALDRMTSAAHDEDTAGFATADLDFHTAFYSIAGHRRLEAVWHQYRPTFADMLAVTNAEDRDLFPTLQDHVDLLRAIEASDTGHVESLLKEHVDGSHRRMLAAYTRLVDVPMVETGA